jgi:hypothetical protein
MVASSDLIHLLVQHHGDQRVSVFSLPALAEYRYPFQTIAALHSSIQSHLDTIQQHMAAVMASWKNALRPLDTKLDALKTTLQKYGVDSTAMRY